MTAVAKLAERVAEVLPPKPIGDVSNYAFIMTPQHSAELHNRFARLTAALSHAELGGVVLFHRLHQPNYSSEWIRGDYTGPESTQRGWSVERVYSTPRAAEAVE